MKSASSLSASGIFVQWNNEIHGNYCSSESKDYRRRIVKNPNPIAAAPIATAGSSGDSGDVVGQGVGIFIVDVLIVVTVVTGAAGVVSTVIWPGTRVSLA